MEEVVFTCVYCRGLGYNITVQEENELGEIKIIASEPCNWCDGTGQVVHKPEDEDGGENA
jgi:DnaJ-class molecular chaperone